MRGRTCKGNRLLTPPAVPRVGRMKRTLVVSAIVATVLTASVTLSVEARTHPASRGYQKHHAPTPTPSPAATPTPTLSATAMPTPTPTPGGTLPNFSHVFVIVMENAASSAIVGNGAAPYVNGLLRPHRLAARYYRVSHPCLPNS